MEAAAGPAIPALRSAAAGRVGSYGTSLLPRCRERYNEILGQKAGANSFPVGVWTKEDEKNVKGQFARTKIGWCGVGHDQQKGMASSEDCNRKGKPSSRGK